MRLEEAFGRTALSEVVDYDVFRRHCPTAHVKLSGPGQSVFTEGSDAHSFSLLVTGRVKLVKQQGPGKESILDFVDVGTAICPTKPHHGSAYCCRAMVAAHATRVLVLSQREVLELVRAVPEVMGVFIDMLSDRTERMCARVSELSSGRVQRRVASLLLRLAKVGTREEDLVRIELPLSRREIAEMTGTTVESAIRSMRELEKREIVRTHSSGFEILNEEALREIAEGP